MKFNNQQVDEFEARMRECEKGLESAGRLICDVEGGGESRNDVNRALNAVSEAIHSAWKMRPVCAAVLSAILLWPFVGQAEKVDRAALLDAIAMVESDRGATSQNMYQLRPIFVRDVNRIKRWFLPHWLVANDRKLAEAYINAYWDFYGKLYERRTGKAASAQVLARMHNGGGEKGWDKDETLSYWRRVRKYYIQNTTKKGN